MAAGASQREVKAGEPFKRALLVPEAASPLALLTAPPWGASRGGRLWPRQAMALLGNGVTLAT